MISIVSSLVPSPFKKNIFNPFGIILVGFREENKLDELY